jgi:GT2 family glycosyltransferase
VERTGVAVAIVNANSGPHLRRALDALRAQSVPPDKTIVVDNASTDGSADNLELDFPSVEVVRLEENVGFAAANNLATRRVSSKWIALVNPDAFPDTRWLEELLDAAGRHPEFTFFASRTVKDADPYTLDTAGDELHVSGVAWQRGRGTAAAAATTPGEVFSASAVAALYRRDVFLAVGGFDERFFCYYEDTDIAFRLRLTGHRCWYVPTAVVRHVGSATARRESDFMTYHTHRNIVWTYAKDMPSPLIWLYLPQHLLVNLLTVAAFAARGRVRVILRAKRDALRALPAILAERRAVQRDRVVSARDMRNAMAKGFTVVPILLRRQRDLQADAR